MNTSGFTNTNFRHALETSMQGMQLTGKNGTALTAAEIAGPLAVAVTEAPPVQGIGGRQ